MPYHITSSTDKFEVVDDAGKVMGTHPTRKQAVAQLQALYANVPDAKKELDEAEKATADINALPDSAFLYVESGGDKDEEGKTVPRSLRHLPYKTPDGGIDLPKLRNALSRLGQSATGTTGGERWLTEGVRKSLVSKAQGILEKNTDAASAQTEKKEALEPEVKQSILDRVIAALKGDTPGHPFRGNQFSGGDGGGSEHIEGSGSEARSHGAFSGKPEKKLPKGKFTHSSGQEVDINTDAFNEAKVSHQGKHIGTLSGRNGEYHAAPTGNVETGHFDNVNSAVGHLLRNAATKEGKRNSSPDGDRLQQIHDLSVLNGASCPMVMKEASGKLRWVLLSSNAFQDSDKEIISQKALEADVARTDKEQAPYGPLRWWHMGEPDPIGLSAGSGADIGDCDYRAMSGRVLIESGTFRNERIGEAIKQRADTLAGSIGFFHPKDEPDSEGIYRNIVQFERSLLPRGKASNTLTALTVKGDQDMATSKEKTDALAALLGDQSLAESVIKQAEVVEKQADDRGLKYKEDKAAEKAMTGTPTAVSATGANGINPIGLEDEKKAKKPEGAPGEESAEPKAEAESEPDWEKMMKGLAPHINKLIEEKMKANAKEASEKEAGIKAQLDQISADVKELKGDVPRGLQGGFRASIADATILSNVNFKNAPAADPMDSVIDQLMGLKNKAG